MKKDQLIDGIVLTLLTALAGTITVVFHASFLVSTLFFFLVPIGYLGMRMRHNKQWKRIIASSLLFGALYGFLFDYIAERSGAWAWPANSYIVGTWEILGVVNPASYLWVFLWVTLIILFYEHFVERDSIDIVSRRFWAALIPGLATLAVILATHFTGSTFFEWTYAYLILSLLTLPPVIILLWRKPSIFPKLLAPMLFFVPMHTLLELVGLYEGQWIFPGSYIGTVHLLNIGFLPLEELIIWILLGSVIVVAYHELYVDDMK